MVVEELTFEVEPEVRERWLAREHEVWSQFFSGQPGYLGKQVWQPTDVPTTVVVLVWWASLDAWQAVPGGEVEATEQQMGDLRRPRRARAYEVLRREGR